jgi:hypothetical protein
MTAHKVSLQKNDHIEKAALAVGLRKKLTPQPGLRERTSITNVARDV